ncbi:hypothetical protein [Micromonospora narathiwatensis]|uniref:Uncharacterized protein n=1 Tax=Micromonospora narathiwatensis TaxID=299146 RepID=A0A1A9ACU6_9ACTN|nr:hypothetical protein [Micromonospora narathiwatensis]SBT54324.1 hypothetical protein GA0070621_5334 [Micromonospora narathiwatensis]
MPIARFNSSGYPPRGSRRAAWGGVVVVVVVVLVLGFAAGYGEAVMGALATAVVSAAVTEIIKVRIGSMPRNA